MKLNYCIGSGNTDSLKFRDFETQYQSLRLAEGRIFSIDEVVKLPAVNSDHPHYREWVIRKNSSERLVNYIRKKERVLNVLEAGCGNGWLAARIADVKNTKVTGIDLNRLELMQALIAFEGRRNLYFIFGEMSEIRLKENSFDIIVFASSLQYFSSLNETIGNALRLLSEQGEIHIIDTPFYKESELIAASERTSEYYSCLGFQQMREFYFHHSLKELEPFNWKVMYNPNSVQNAFLRKKYPFHWIRVRK